MIKGEDYTNAPDFLTAVKREFICLSANQPCPEQLPIDCPQPR